MFRTHYEICYVCFMDIHVFFKLVAPTKEETSWQVLMSSYTFTLLEIMRKVLPEVEWSPKTAHSQ